MAGALHPGDAARVQGAGCSPLVLHRANPISPNTLSALKIDIAIFKSYLIYKLVKQHTELTWICHRGLGRRGGVTGGGCPSLTASSV